MGYTVYNSSFFHTEASRLNAIGPLTFLAPFAKVLQ